MAVAKQNGDVIPFVKQKDYIMVNNDLGGGSFGKTVLLQDPFIDELFVAKKYEPEYDGIKEQFYKNFLDEIKILYKLNHRNIVRIYNYYAYENIYTGYILMEYIDGENIGDFISDYFAPFAETTLDDVFLQLIDVFCYIEAHGIIHRDIREGNILVDKSGTVKVIDFGIGKIASKVDDGDADSLVTDINRAASNTLPQEYYDGIYTNLTDMFYLAELFRRLIDNSKSCDRTDFSYNDILNKMMEKKPENRFASFAAIREAIGKHDFLHMQISDEDREIYQEFTNLIYESLTSYIVDELSRRTAKPKFIFASPNIPNPQEYLSLLASGEYDKQNAIASAFSPVVQFKFLVNLKTKQIYIYNDHLKTLEYICSINANPEDGVIPLMGLFYKNSGERTSRMIAYFSSKDKAINAALTFAELQKQIDGGTQKQIDPELAELARDVRNQVHRDYFLAGLLEQGIAYHIGYLPSAIRMRIEKLFKDEKITAMFCTSTLVEGVNLPADNLFITSYYSGRAQMTDVDFRNLVGRVGRIQYNLSGNVFMISDETRNNKQDVYLDKLKSGIPDQHLSLVQDLKPKHKKRIIEILLSGSSVIDKYNDDQPEEEYIMMRKFGLILLKDILHDNDSLIQQEFRKYMKDGDEEKIKNIFSQYTPIIDSDINISLDQTRKLRAAISADSTFAYPLPESNGSFNVDEVFGFLIRLGDIFDWKRYEYSTLGKCDEDGDYTKLRWYAVILVQWMEGKGLNYIMRRAVEYQERHPEKFWINRYTKQYYDKNSLEHRNIVFANTLEVIENVILFSISNYFLRFSNEYKRVHGEKSLNRNNWYEYVEYGTTNEVTIQLQRYGFSRESATYIKAHPQYFTVDGEGNVHVKNDLENCGDNEVVQQIPDIRFNTPELFVE